jgi:hypothetical protein
MGRIKIIGKEKCPHPNKKTGERDCNKRGRLNPKPMVSWNTKLNFDQHRKRQYFQFIHNNGTRHNISISTTQGTEKRPSEEEQKDAKKESRLYNTIRKASLTTPWLLRLKPADRENILSQFAAGNKGPLIESFKQYDSSRRRDIYDRSKRFQEELYSYTQTPLYEAIYDFVHIEIPEMPFNRRRIDQLYQIFEPKMANTIVDEKRKFLKGLRLNDKFELKRKIRKRNRNI